MAECPTGLLHLGCAREISQLCGKHNTAGQYQASPAQTPSDVSHETAPAEKLRDAPYTASHGSAYHPQISLPAKTRQKGPSTGLLHRHCCISPSLQATCVPVPNPAAHMHKYTRHQHASTYKDQLTTFPTMSSTILSWRKDTDDQMK